MENIIENNLNELECFYKKILDLSKEMVQVDIYPLDHLATGVLNRTLSIIDGFCLLIRNENFTCAVHLVRLHLDNVIRFHAAWLVDDPHKFALEIIAGTQINHIKDRTGTKMNDKYLVSCLAADYPWIEKVYTETSGFIHLSNKHVFLSSKVKDKNEKTIQSWIGRKDKFVNESSIIEAIQGMIAITDCLYDLAYGWTYTKTHPFELNNDKNNPDSANLQS